MKIYNVTPVKYLAVLMGDALRWQGANPQEIASLAVSERLVRAAHVLVSKH